MASLTLYTLLIIFFQTVFVLILSWCTLSCRFPPSPTELQEITLMKLLYLYDPVACGRVESYNFTTTVNDTERSTIIWPSKNEIAATFRWRLKYSLTLHIIWLCLGVASALYGQRPFGLHLAVLPFTVTGATLLVSDVYIVTIYLMDVEYTRTEESIIRYIGAGGDFLGEAPGLSTAGSDTSWPALLMAFMSSRAIVLWIINYWLVVDNFLAGLQAYRDIKKAATIPKRRVRERRDLK